MAFRMITCSGSGWGFSVGPSDVGVGVDSSHGGVRPRFPMDNNEVCSPCVWSGEACEGEALDA